MCNLVVMVDFVEIDVDELERGVFVGECVGMIGVVYLYVVYVCWLI